MTTKVEVGVDEITASVIQRHRNRESAKNVNQLLLYG
ncbi:MAG: hypothetical protein CM15mP51_06340 [Porticoccaceae bacterium]|nr:MAG: hypothetical protein CM15mP51_06340 [Porticoccaceae bacterium]